MRTVKVAAGIGDNVWILQKLINAHEKFIFQIPDGKPQRGKQIFDLLPEVAFNSVYVSGLNYEKLYRENIQRKKPYFRDVREGMFHLCMNAHLEKGYRIEGFMPDLETSFTLPWETKTKISETDFNRSETYIGIYGSSYSTTRAWGFWQEQKWFDLIEMVHKANPNYVFVLIGADFDMDLAGKLSALLKKRNIPYVSTIGKSLGYVVELMKILSYAIYFPSGLPILSQTVKNACGCLMFYPLHLEKMMGTYRDPSRDPSEFKEVLFCEPKEVFDFLKNDYKLFEKYP